MAYFIDMHYFLRSCNHLIPLKVEDGPASQNCGCEYIDRLNIKETWSY